MRILTLDKVDSTNLEAKRYAEVGNLGPLWIRAHSQTAGHGRRGRSWVSEPGNLFASGLYPHMGEVKTAALFSFVAALAVAQTLEPLSRREALQLKWPNDVLVDGKKVCGILLETGQTQAQKWIVIGIGINLNSHPNIEDYAVTHIGEHMASKDQSGGPNSDLLKISPEIILVELVRCFEHWREIFLKEGFSPIREAWLSWTQAMPTPVTVRLDRETFSGEAVDLGADGELRVRLANGTYRDIHSGDVFFDEG